MFVNLIISVLSLIVGFCCGFIFLIVFIMTCKSETYKEMKETFDDARSERNAGRIQKGPEEMADSSGSD